MDVVDPLQLPSGVKDINGIIMLYRPVDLLIVCRICLNKLPPPKNTFNLFEKTDAGVLSEMIMECTSVKVEKNDGLPSSICKECKHKLKAAWEFKIQCENSDLKLREYCMPSEIAQDNSQSNDLMISAKGTSSSPIVEDFSAQQHDLLVPLKVIDENDSAEKVPVENNLIKDSNNSSQETNGNKRIRNRSNKIHTCDICGNTFKRKEYLTQHMRIHTGEKPYPCQICDRRFSSTGHRSTHTRIHKGEKPHRCHVCSKPFRTKQQLAKHLMVHNSDKPYVCKMCDRRFGSSRNLNAHFKHHTGLKNFTCATCSKSFFTKQQLTQHFVIHTGEKQHVCTFCPRRFAQRAHLKGHLKTHNTS